jgi:phosphoribosylglycinamide formyltransferase-1
LLNIGWFSTGRDEAARQLLQAVQDKSCSGDINGKISFVFSNREPGEAKESDLFFELVRSYNIPLVYLSHKKFKTGKEEEDLGIKKEWRIKYDRAVNKKIEPFVPDLCVLAGYMLIVSAELCQKYDMINLHPAPPGGPTGSWQEVIWTLIKNKADTAGAMMHLVTPELDRGPAVSYCLFSIKGEPFAEYWRKDNKDMLFRLIRQHELAREFPLIILTLQSLSQGEVGIKARRVIDAQGKPIKGYDLSAKIDRAVEGSLR